MKLIVGLGNPGKKYEKTRHNCGFLTVQYFASANRFPEFAFAKKFNSLISQKDEIILVLPQTFMNESGRAVKKIKDFYKISPENILIIHDDIDLKLGAFKICQKRGAAGHKGVQSIIDALKTKNFIRCRIGIACLPASHGRQISKLSSKKIKAEDFVLKKFSKKELAILEEVIKKIAEEISA